MITRRTFALQAACFVLTTLPVGCLSDLAGAEGASKPAGVEELKRSRKKAAHRRRRIIVNNDGNEPVYRLDEATPKALLDCRTSALADTRVDGIFYCTWCSGFGMFTHDTKVGEVFDTTANPTAAGNKKGGFSKNKTADFIRQGTDPLKIMVEWCRRNDKEIFWSCRMNDTHDAWNGWYSPYLFPRLKREHPNWLVSDKKRGSRCGGWTAVDYARPEIRDLACKYFEEVCRNYDVDGVELDFFRHPVFFKRHAMGNDVGQEERDMMTDLLRRIRMMTEKVGLSRGRPILVGIRVPDSVGFCEAVGLDVVRWLEEDLVDIMIVSGYFRLNPWETSVSLGHKYDVPVYASLSETRLKDDQAAAVRRSNECYRARALNAWEAGADGIYMFNAFDPHSPLWRELGDPKTIPPLDKVYTTGARGVNAINRWLVNGDRFLNRRTVSPERPLALTPGKAVRVRLDVGEDPDRKESRGKTSKVALHLRVERLKDPAELSVKLNDHSLTKVAQSGGRLIFDVNPAIVRKGNNCFDIMLHSDGTAEPSLLDLLLWVR